MFVSLNVLRVFDTIYGRPTQKVHLASGTHVTTVTQRKKRQLLCLLTNLQSRDHVRWHTYSPLISVFVHNSVREDFNFPIGVLLVEPVYDPHLVGSSYCLLQGLKTLAVFVTAYAPSAMHADQVNYPPFWLGARKGARSSIPIALSS